MKISENPGFNRELRKLLEANSVHVSGFNLKIEELIKKYEDDNEKPIIRFTSFG